LKGGALGRPGVSLPGPSYLLPPGLGKEAARILAHGGVKAAPLSGTKGTITVAPGINAFVSPGVASDGSLGSGVVSYGNSTYTIPASVGTQVGGNLFESFSQFGLLQGQVANFQGPSSVADIIARVTGGNASSIDGTIESSIQGANLFLINPAGVMFGPNASLNVSGAFTVSTADYVKLADGGQFNASLGANDMLTAAPVSAFGFVSATPAPVSFSGSQLSVPTGAGLNVIAGDVTLDSATGDTTTPGATLSAPSGGLTVFSAASAGEVPFSLATPGAGYSAANFTAFGALSLSNGSSMVVDGLGGGAMVIRAGMISVDDSTIGSANSGSIAGGDITIDAENALSVVDGGLIISVTEGIGPAGNISIQAGSLNMDGSAVPAGFTGITSGAEEGMGNGGDLDIAVTGALDMEGGAKITTVTSSSGNGGSLTIDAGSLDIDGSVTPSLVTEIRAISGPGATGNAGDINITVSGALDIEGGEISANTFSAGKGGNLTIQAASLNIDGLATPTLFTGIAAESDASATGDAGDLNITVTGVLDVEGGGEITADTFSAGNGGDVIIKAGSLDVDGSATPTLVTGIGAQSDSGATGNAGDLTINVAGAITLLGGGEISANTGSQGNGGTLIVRAGSLDIESGGEISADTLSSGQGGNLNIEAGSLDINGSATPASLTGITAKSEPGATGNAGDLNVTVAGALDIQGGEISAGTFSSGNGGNLIIHAGSLDINGLAAPELFTGIAAESNPGATGNAGDLNVTVTGAFDIQNAGEISTDTFSSGKGGSLTVKAGSLNIDGSATPDLFTGIVADSDQGATGNSSEIDVTVTGALDIGSGGQISTDTFSSGNGGNVTIQAGSLNIDGSPTLGLVTGIGAQSDVGATGNAGNVTVNVAGAITILGDGEISATTFSSGNGGSLTVHAGSLDIAGVATLNGSTCGIFDASDQGATGDSDGMAGDLSVSVTGALTIVDGGEVSGGTFSSGNGGKITIQAGSLEIDGAVAQNAFTGIGAQSSGEGAGPTGDLTVNVAGAVTVIEGGEISADTFSSGKSGNLTVEAGSVDIESGGEISADTFSSGAGGNLTINAGSLKIDGLATQTEDTGISAKSERGATGNAGDLNVTVSGAIDIEGGDISAGAFSTGQGGNLTIQAGSLNINGSAGPTLFTGIATQSEPGATGNAGDLNLTVAGALDIEGAGEISATTFSFGKGGDLNIQAGSVDIDGSTAPAGRFTGIVAASYATSDAGDAGSISIQCDNLALNARGEISTSAVAASAGDITIDVQQIATLEDQGSISSSAGVSGGNITIQAGELLYLLDSSITATAGTDRSAHGSGSAPNAGNGGNITIDPEFIVLDDSLISANAAIGQGGNIFLDSTYYLNSGSTITATGATSGTVTIASPELDLSGALVGLPSAPVGSETQLQETCAVAINGDFSSFLAVGQGDVEAAPDEAQGGTGDGGDDRRERVGHPKPAHRSGIGL